MSTALQREEITAGLLAAAVHGFFVLLLVIGVSWQIHDPQPVMAELWQALPAPSRPAPPREPAPPPEARPQPEPELKAADIALEKKKQEEKRRKEAQLKKEEDQRRELELARETARSEALKREQEKKLAAEAKRREVLRREEEDMQRRLLEESLAAETGQVKARAAAERQRLSEIGKIVADYKNRISVKVRGNTRLPDNLAGNPEVEFDLSVLPTGEITKIRLRKTSGNTAFDQAVQRGIEKSSPLPLPPDKAAAVEFRNLLLKHKARE